MSNDNALKGIHIVAKPIGPRCNLNCDYCFNLEKQALFESGEHFRMTDDLLSAFITRYISSQPTPVVEFVWQGGEPVISGPDFLRRVAKLRKPFTAAGSAMCSRRAGAGVRSIVFFDGLLR